MFEFFKHGRGARVRDSENGVNYLSGSKEQPFPMNPFFRSEPVLSEMLRDEVYRRVTVAKESLKLVSAELGIDVRRVAAVVRMKEIEKQWVKEVSTQPFLLSIKSPPFGGFILHLSQHHDDQLSKIRLVLKTQHMVTPWHCEPL